MWGWRRTQGKNRAREGGWIWPPHRLLIDSGEQCQEIAWKSPHGPELEGAILELAERQHGHVTRRQLLGLGLQRGAIDGASGVGCVGPGATAGCMASRPRRDGPAWRGRPRPCWRAGTARCSATSRRRSLWGFVPALEPFRWRSRSRTAGCVHAASSPIVARRSSAGTSPANSGCPTTSPARTILDIAPRLTVKQRTRLVNDARREGFLHPDSFTDILARNPYHPGARLLTPFAEDPANPTRSPFEDDFLAFIAEVRLPTPQINVTVGGREVDAYFPEHHLIVELDGWDYHKDRDAFEDRPRTRRREPQTRPETRLRITKQRMTPDPRPGSRSGCRRFCRTALGRPRLLLRTSSRTLTGSSRVGGPIRDRKMCPIQERTRT